MKGIRAYTVSRFSAHLAAFLAAELSARDFRRKVCDEVSKKFDISLNAAGAHYNYALKTIKSIDPESVAGLGRAEDKKGGRPVTNPVQVINARTGKIVADGVSRGAATDLVAAGGVLANGSYRLAIKDPAAAVEASEAVTA